jgi:hypothetical protein
MEWFGHKNHKDMSRLYSCFAFICFRHMFTVFRDPTFSLLQCNRKVANTAPIPNVEAVKPHTVSIEINKYILIS